MEVGAIIREVRKNNGYTQVELAKKIGIAVNSLRLYEAGKISPPMSVLERLAEVTKTRIQLFLPLGEWKDIFKRLPHGVSEAEFLHSISMEIDAPIGKVESVVSSGEDSLFSQTIKMIALQLLEELYNINGPVNSDAQFNVRYKALTSAFMLLNSEGQEKAVERISELTEIERYRVNEKPKFGEQK